MPPALLSHAFQQGTAENRPREMMDTHRVKRTDPALCPTDSEAVSPEREKPHKQSLDYVWRTGLAGGLAGCAAKSVVAPLDRVKILFQASNPQFAKYAGSWVGVAAAMKDIYKDEGAKGLYRGHSATVLRIFPYAAIKFVAYEQIRAVLIPTSQHETPFRRLISGSLAGVTSVFFTYPLEVIRVRLAFETKKDHRSSFREIVHKIYREEPPLSRAIHATSSQAATTAAQSIAKTAATTLEAVAPRAGITNFYRGFSATIMGMIPYAGMSFLTHDTAHDIFRLPSVARYTTVDPPPNAPAGKLRPLNWWAQLIAGGIAGIVSQTSSYPLEVIRRRMQVGGAVGDGHRLRITETFKMILREKGPTGFFVGLSIGYVKVAPMAAVSFYVYERGKTLLGV